MANSQSRTTLQNILDRILPFGDIKPVLTEAAGYEYQPFLTICTDVMNEICGVPFPHKWNEIKIPQFYTNSFQQDYVILNPDRTSFYNLEWLERGMCVEMTSTALPKPWGYVECARQLVQATGTITQISSWNNPTFEVNSFPNSTLYYGTWGAATTGTPSFGNDPQPGSLYTNPLLANGTQQNPITQIIDTQGNIQVVTTYGTCGNTQPAWPATNAPFGTTTPDGSTVWTVVDPNGIGMRILPVPSSSGVVFQFNLIGQMPPVRFTNLSNTISPLPDKYESYFRQGVIAQCYRYASDPKVQAKFDKNYKLWQKSLNDLRAVQDRELEENCFAPERGIMGSRRNTYVGAAWPFQGFPGW